VDDLTSVTEETVTLRCNGRETLLDLQVVGADYGDSGSIPFWGAELQSAGGQAGATTNPDDLLAVCQSDTAWFGGAHVLPVTEKWVLIHRNPINHPGSTMRLHMRSGNGSATVSNTMGIYVVSLPGDSELDLKSITWATRPTLGTLLGSIISTSGSPFDFTLDVSVGEATEDVALAFATPVWATNPSSNNCRFDPADDSPPVRQVVFL
jgi:hypothetical protein